MQLKMLQTFKHKQHKDNNNYKLQYLINKMHN